MTGGASSYRKGAAFERKVADLLRQQGWVVTRSPASKSPYDLHCHIRYGHDVTIWLVQCKVTGRIDPGERAALIDVCEPSGAIPILAFKWENSVFFREVTLKPKESSEPWSLEKVGTTPSTS